MADQADIETALASIVANSLYPNGSGEVSAIGYVCRIYRGFPTAPSLDRDLAAGVLHVSVSAAASPLKNVTRYPRQWVSVTPVAAVLNAASSGQSATFSGTCAVGQLVGAIINRTAFAYAVQSNDSPATVASNLAAIIRTGGFIVDYSGATISCQGADQFIVRVVRGAGSLQEIKRQVQDFKISLWCPDPSSRDAAAPVIEIALVERNFIALSDGSFGRMIFAGSMAQDNAADASLYRRDLTYSVEYPTTTSQLTPAMLFGNTNVSTNGVSLESLQS